MVISQIVEAINQSDNMLINYREEFVKSSFAISSIFLFSFSFTNKILLIKSKLVQGMQKKEAPNRSTA